MKLSSTCWCVVATVAVLTFTDSISAEILTLVTNGVNDVISLADNNQAVDLRRIADSKRKQMLLWKEFDFHTLFGEPVIRVDQAASPVFPGSDFARLSTEFAIFAFGGLRTQGNNKDHSDLYDVGSLGRIEVFFGPTGEPVGIAFFVKVDSDFVLLGGESDIARRLAWERPRLAAMIREIDMRWRRMVVWEVDREKQVSQLQGLNSTNPAEVWRAFEEWIQPLGYQLVEGHPTAGLRSRQWYDGGKLKAEVTLYDSEDRALPPTSIDLTIDLGDGIVVKKAYGIHRIGSTFWRRPSGKDIRYEGEAITNTVSREGPQLPGHWVWFDEDGVSLRDELDTNGDGLPDNFWQAGMPINTLVPLPIERSWAVHSDLIPPQCHVPDEEKHQLPVRRIAE